VNYHGNRIDIGGHRFFSKNQRVMQWWQEVMPLQGAPAADDLLLQRMPPCALDGPDPQKQDRVMLQRNRVSRIFYLRNFFDYPISLKWQTFANMGLWRTLKAGVGYLWAQIHKRQETSLENFYINRFGKPLYSMFFEDYTEKVWGVHPSKLGADWGAQRVKGLSVFAILKDMFMKRFSKKADNQKVETSLIESFIYPKYGPGQLWEAVAHDVQAAGGDIRMKQEVVGVNVEQNRVKSVTIRSNDGLESVMPCDYFLSSMPLKDLVAAIRGVDVPADVKKIAAELPYRDFITVGLLVDKLKIENSTKIKTLHNRVPDTWIYIQERDVKIGRLQVFNNWSPYMVADFENKVWIGLEYFCSEGDELWEMTDQKFIAMAIDELTRIGIIAKEDVEDAVRIKVKKAYPSYFGSYYQLDTVKQYLDSIENLFCIGRNGQHRYNNMDHSMLTAIEAVAAIHANSTDKRAIWSVNTETAYHETKK
jgi:protoporphyrinogen oxidase